MKVFLGCASAEQVTRESYESTCPVIQMLAEMEGVDVVLGGADSGYMEFCYHTFREYGKEVTLILDKEYAPSNEKYLEDNVFIEETTMDRTKHCYQESDMAIFVDGGLGTVREIFSFMDEKRTRKDYHYPIYLYNKTHSYDPILALLRDGEKRGTINHYDATGLFEETKDAAFLKEQVERQKNQIEMRKGVK